MVNLFAYCMGRVLHIISRWTSCVGSVSCLCCRLPISAMQRPSGTSSLSVRRRLVKHVAASISKAFFTIKILGLTSFMGSSFLFMIFILVSLTHGMPTTGLPLHLITTVYWDFGPIIRRLSIVFNASWLVASFLEEERSRSKLESTYALIFQIRCTVLESSAVQNSPSASLLLCLLLCL